jgi:hypothetical protein
MSTYRDRVAQQPVQHDSLQCQQDARISRLLLDLGPGGGLLPQLPLFEKYLCLWQLAEMYVQCPPGRGASTS